VNISHLAAVAIKKSGIANWEPYFYEVVGSDAFLIKGGIPRLLKSGPRKGQKTWDAKSATKLIVTKIEVAAERARYERETGNCSNCFGEGKVTASARMQGTEVIRTYRPCPNCSATGKAD
jgi:hypothetical protein